MTPKARIAQIERRRRARNMTVADLCAAAEVSVRAYHYGLRGANMPRPATLARLERALSVQPRHMDAVRLAPVAAFRAMVAAIAPHFGCEADQVLAFDPARRATADPAWMKAMSIRRAALHVLNGGAGMTMHALANAADVTPAAVSIGIAAVEDMRDTDPALDSLLDRMHALITGGVMVEAA